MNILIQDVLTLKKPHPCGSHQWLVLRVGMDFKLRCMRCSHEIMTARRKVEKSIRRIERNGEVVSG